ncbi:2-phosphosulfolactate phosphatase [Fulvivirga sp. M361]|uniref:2-phosphosulfolactate phosphatase n=1 Tax=Fulvivirga sp. M361 TaxID=2594266 RepID=UPI00117B4628|nr:2-phosphosulfolactate phosphatase [Fulvivirga sp. M361]TRX56291.1 2-phosphosulfolactate phosphatase [Fulvivirga sp. M361]
MKTIDVCLSPDLIHLHDISDKNVVVVDILRATSCMVSGLANGVKSITPFASLDLCCAMKEKGYLIAGERGGQKVEGFDLGNSPFDYMNAKVKGHKIAVTTTNGTVAIDKSKGAVSVVIGAFLNLSAVASYLRKREESVLIFCAGWKGKVNLEDSLFAGALVEELQNDFTNECDSPLLVQAAYQNMKHDLVGFIKNSSHAKRLNRLNVHEDIEFCMKQDEYDVLPVLNGDELVTDQA